MSSSHPYANQDHYNQFNTQPDTSDTPHRPPRQPLPALPSGVPAQGQFTPPLQQQQDGYSTFPSRARGDSSPVMGRPHLGGLASPTILSYQQPISHNSRPPDQPSFDPPAASPALPPPPSSTHSRSSAAASSSSQSGALSSKSVLTNALQRAQSAVLLDSANNVPAAIAAYQSSVRLLEQVMARVDEGTRRERDKEAEKERRRQAGLEPAETADERDHRLAKLERKERAKEDEARRLKVIHDTYEDRIRMLLSMSPTAETHDTSTPSLPSSPNSISTAQPSPTTATTFVLPGNPQRHRNDRSITSLSTVSSPPATFDTRGSQAPQLPPVVVDSVAAGDESVELIAEGIASAMMLGSSPPASPMDPAMPGAGRRPRAIGELATVDSNGSLTPTAQSLQTPTDGSRSRTSTSSGGTVVPSNGFHTGTAQPELDWQSDSAEQFFAATSSASPEAIPSIELSEDTSRGQRNRSLSAASSESEAVPVTALEYDPSWPHASSPPTKHEATLSPVNEYSSQSSNIGMAFGGAQQETGPTSESMRFTNSTDSSATLNGALMARLGSATSESMARQGSSESYMSIKGNSLFGPGGFQGLTQVTPPTHANEFVGSASGTLNRPRPTRSASLANPVLGPQPGTVSNGRGPSMSVGGKRPVLVSATTTMGTISQRRKPTDMTATNSQQSIEVLHDDFVEEEEEEDEEQTVKIGGHVVSGSWSGPNEFGHAPSASLGGNTSSGNYASASLPMRLRTLSQPGKRPAFPTYESERPALPPLALAHQQGNRSVSGPNFSRKNSVPTPTSLNAPPFPQLGRSNSGSSFGSESRSPALGTVGLAPAPASGAAQSIYFGPDGQVSAVRRPFYMMRLLLASMDKGERLSPRLFVPPQMWSQAGVKLVAVETKVRMLDLLLTGLETIDKVGQSPVRLVKELEALEGLMEGIQSTLSKKLGFVDPTGGKKAGGGTAFSTWSGKLSRSLDRVANGRGLDSPAVYVEGITKVFSKAQHIDAHILSLEEGHPAYAQLAVEDRRRVEARLRRASEFFSATVVRFVLRDVGMLLDKYVKKSAVWLTTD